MRSWIVIGLWVLAILFPLAWLGTLSPAWRDLIDWLLAPEWLHVLMHTLIYAGLVILILAQRRGQGKDVTLTALVVVILTVGVAQEALQYITDDERVSLLRSLRGSAFDLMVDLAGGMIGLGIFYKLWRRPAGAQVFPEGGEHGED